MEIVKPHKKISRECIESDTPLILEHGKKMHELCHQSAGRYSGGLAIAHCQVEEKDPLRFFVTKEEAIIINPEIINHTKVTVDSEEGCLSFPDRPETIVQRYNKVCVKYKTVSGAIIRKDFGGKIAKVFQHELDHMNGKYIFDEEEK